MCRNYVDRWFSLWIINVKALIRRVDIKPGISLSTARRVRGARVAAIALSAAMALSQAAEADSVARSFNVSVQLSAPPVQLAAPLKSVALNNPGASARALSAAHALSIRASSTGYMLQLEVIDPTVRSVEIMGLGRPIHLTTGVRQVFVPPDSDAEDLTLSYTVTYAEPVQPGALSIPFRATIMP